MFIKNCWMPRSNPGLAYTRDFVSTLFKSAKEAVAEGINLKQAMTHTRKAMDPKFGDVFIYEHCLPFDVTRAVGRSQRHQAPANLNRRPRQGNVAQPSGS